MNAIKSVFIFFNLLFLGLITSPLFAVDNEVLEPLFGSFELPACGEKRCLSDGDEAPAKRFRPDFPTSLIKKFSEQEWAIIEELFQSDTLGGSLQEQILAITTNYHRNPLLAGIAIYLRELGISSDLIYQIIDVIKQGALWDRFGSSTPDRMYMDFQAINDEIDKGEIAIYFKQQFIKHWDNYFAALLKKNHSDKNRLSNFAGKIAILKEKRNYVVEENLPTLNSHLPLLFLMTEFEDKAKEAKPQLYSWINKYVDDDAHKIVLYSVIDIRIDGEELTKVFRALPKSLESQSLMAALSVYLFEFGLPSKIIYDFFMEMRKNRPTNKEFYEKTVKNKYLDFLSLKGADDTLNACHRKTFALLLIDIFLPMLKKLTGLPEPHFANHELLLKLYQMQKPKKKEEYVGNVFFEISDDRFETLKKEVPENLLVLKNYILDLDIDNNQKAAFLSLLCASFDKEYSLIEKLQSLAKSIHGNSIIAALTIYLHHFGIHPENIYSFILKARENCNNSSLFSVKLVANTCAYYFRMNGDKLTERLPHSYGKLFPDLINGFFANLLKENVGAEARFENSELWRAQLKATAKKK